MRRALWLLTILVVVLLGVGVYVAYQHGKLPIDLAVGKGCKAQTDEGTVHLYPEQMANAATIAAVGLARGISDRGVVIALATAMQESDLYNLDYGDRDSLGLFQQRPSQDWGEDWEVMDPRYAAGAFYDALLRVPGWESMRLTEAAQAVQRSAYPEAYQKWAEAAQVVGEALVGTHETAVTCTKVSEPTLRGEAAMQALAVGVRADWGELAATVPAARTGSLTLAAGQERVGWQLAHWLVAHSANHGVSRVRFGEHEWTIDSGRWQRLGDQPADDVPVVVADVFPG
jgi:hypothetical protein